MPTGDTIGDPIVTKTYRVDALFDDAIEKWNQYIQDCDDYVKKKQFALFKAHYKTLRFRAYGKVLTQIIEAFSFHKKRSADFQHDPADILHNIPLYRHYGDSSFLRNTGGGLERRGSIEYLAASIADPEFLELSRIRAALHDITQIHSFHYDGGLSDFFEKYCPGEINYPICQAGDFFRGAKFDLHNQIYGNNYRMRGVPRKIIGAELRITQDLSQRFNNLANDFAKRHEVIAIRDYVLGQCKTVDKTIGFEKGKEDSIVANNPTYREASELYELRQHAYLKFRCLPTIDVVENDILTAVEENLRPSRYADDNRLAPPFETLSDIDDRIDPGSDDYLSLTSKELQADLDAMIFDFKHAARRSTELKMPTAPYNFSEASEIRRGQKIIEDARAAGKRAAEAAQIAKRTGKPVSAQHQAAQPS